MTALWAADIKGGLSANFGGTAWQEPPNSRDDIHAISNFDKDYVPGREVMLNFSFDEHAFVIHKGEKIRIDISLSAFPLYVRHTNQKGLFSEQTTAKVADNTVICGKSCLKILF